MKKLLLSVLLVTAFVAAKAQLSIGAKGGVNLAYIYNHGNVASYNSDPNTTLYAKFTTQYNAGAFVNIPIRDSRFAIQPEVLYSAQGLRLDGADAITEEQIEGINYPSARIRLGYINVPVMLQYRIMMQGLDVELGPQFGFLVSAKNKTTTYDAEGKHVATTNTIDNTRRFDFSLALGISYQYPDIPIGVNIRYTLGLTDVYKGSAKVASSTDKSYTNGVFQAGVFCKFGL